jgi:hypothetical protein
VVEDGLAAAHADGVAAGGAAAAGQRGVSLGGALVDGGGGVDAQGCLVAREGVRGQLFVDCLGGGGRGWGVEILSSRTARR